MSVQAPLTVIENDPGASSAISAQISALGFACTPLQPTADLALSAGGIVVLDAALGQERIEALLNRVHGEDNRFIPVILAGEAGQITTAETVRLVRSGWISLCVPVPFNKAQLDNNIAALSRLSTILDEFLRRAGVLAEFGRTMQSLPAATEISPASTTLLVAGSGRHFQAIETTLSPDVQIASALTPALARDRLAEGGITAMMVDMTADEFAAPMDFVQQVRRDPRYFHLPVILITPAGNSDQDEAFYREGVSDIVHPPLGGGALPVAVLPQMRMALFRQSLKSAYETALSNPVADALTGLYSRGVLLTHLKQMLDQNCRFSVALLSIDNIQDINSQHGYAGGDKIIRQVGKAIELLTRGEDLAARFAGAEFALIMPGTDADDAGTAWRRILAVLRVTSFSPGEAMVTVPVEFRSVTAQPESGDTPESLLERARGRYL